MNNIPYFPLFKRENEKKLFGIRKIISEVRTINDQ